MIIALAGGSGAGKSYLSTRIRDYLAQSHCLRVAVVSSDNYYYNCHEVKFDNYDHPSAINLPLLCDDLLEFFSTGSIKLRRYSFDMKESELIDIVYGVDIVLLEGLYTFFYELISSWSSLNIYLEVDDQIRIQRRILRDALERNISEEENMGMIEGFVLQMHQTYVCKQKDKADIICYDSGIEPKELFPNSFL